MKRQDVKHGVEYAVRRGSYAGSFARILIIGETVRETQAASPYRPAKTEHGLEGKLIEGYYNLGYGSGGAIEKGKTGFVRARDVAHTWEVEMARRANDERLRLEREAAKRADEAERAEFTKRLKALGLDGGIRTKVDGYRYNESSDTLAVRREALRSLIEKAEAA